MGSAVHTLTRSQHLIMKFVLALLFLAGLAFAQEDAGPSAEADPAAWYGYHYGYPYHRGYYGYGGYRGYYGHGYGYGYYGRKKRDAEADPAVLASTSAVTTPQVYAHPYAYGYPYHHVPLTYTHAVTTTPVTYTVPHALTYAHHYPYTYGYGHLPYLIKPAEKEEGRKKREAEGEPEAGATDDI